MKSARPNIVDMNAQDAAAYAMNNDLSEYFEESGVFTERRPAKLVTALRIDVDVQSQLEAAAEARGIGASTLMRMILEEWVIAHRDSTPEDQLGDLVRHLDAARLAASSLAQSRRQH